MARRSIRSSPVLYCLSKIVHVLVVSGGMHSARGFRTGADHISFGPLGILLCRVSLVDVAVAAILCIWLALNHKTAELFALYRACELIHKAVELCLSSKVSSTKLLDIKAEGLEQATEREHLGWLEDGRHLQSLTDSFGTVLDAKLPLDAKVILPVLNLCFSRLDG